MDSSAGLFMTEPTGCSTQRHGISLSEEGLVCSDIPEIAIQESLVSIISCSNCDGWRDALKLRPNAWKRPKRLKCKHQKEERQRNEHIYLEWKVHYDSNKRRKTARGEGRTGCVEIANAVTPSNRARRKRTRTEFHQTRQEYDELMNSAIYCKEKGMPGTPIVSRRIVQAAQPQPFIVETVTAAPIAIPAAESSFNFLKSWYQWKKPVGVALDAALDRMLRDEASKSKGSDTKSKRKVNLEFLETVFWLLLKYLLVGRWMRTKAHVMCLVFARMMKKEPDHFMEHYTSMSRSHARRNCFLCWKFQRTIDLEQAGGLNYACLQSMRRGVEELMKGEYGYIPEKSAVQDTARAIERHAEEEHGLKIQMEMTEHGPSYRFDFDILLRMILTAHGLSGRAETTSKLTSPPVMLAYTLDGAQLTKNLSHVTAGIKIVDLEAKDIKTGKEIVMLTDQRWQSADLCYVAQMVFGKDCKQLYVDCFKDFFNYFNGDVVVPASFGLPELSNFFVVSPQDMSSIWKCTGLGGGSFNKDLFCFICECGRDNISESKQGDSRCAVCKRTDVNICYCHEVTDSDQLEGMGKALDQYVSRFEGNAYSRLDKLLEKSVIDSNPNVLDKEDDANHIEYCPSGRKEAASFKRLLEAELSLRLDDGPMLRSVLVGTLESKRNKLKELIEEESDILHARGTVERHGAVSTGYTRLLGEHAIPCILHAEMRINEKLIYLVFSYALDRYKEVDRKTRKVLIDEVTNCMKTSVLGKVEKGKQADWKFPISPDGKVMKRNLTGTRSRQVLLGLKKVLAVVFSEKMDEAHMSADAARCLNVTKLCLWEDLLDNYLPMMDLARQHKDLSDTEIDRFHYLSSTFMARFVDLFAGSEITNYIHMFGSGHMTYYLRKYRNLYRFSQQGWEMLNKKLKHYYFHNTNHGGSNGNGNSEMIRGDHVLPLMKMCQRSIMWRLGHGQRFFEGEFTKRRLPLDVGLVANLVVDPFATGEI